MKKQFNRHMKGATIAALLSLALLLSGCRTRREIVLEKTNISNQSFDLDRMPENLRLDREDKASFVLLNKTNHQSHHLLQLAPDVSLRERYNRRQDMTIFGVAGRAIVSVEGKRQILQPGGAVFIPRMHYYSVMPHKSPGNVVALMVYSPPFDASDTLKLNR